MNYVFLVVAALCQPWTKTNHQVVEQELECHHQCCDDEEWQVQLPCEFWKTSIDGYFHVFVFHEGLVGSEHPASINAGQDQHEGDQGKGETIKLLTQASNTTGITLKKGSIDNILGTEVEESEGDEYRNAPIEEKCHEHDHIEVGVFLIGIKFVWNHFFVHAFLEDGTFIIFEWFLIADAFVDDEEEPGDHQIDDHVVGVDGGDFCIPEGTVVHIEVNLLNFQ